MRQREPAAALTDPFLASSAVAAPAIVAAAPSVDDLLEMELKPLRREAAVGVDGENDGGEGEEEMKELPKATTAAETPAAVATETATTAEAAANDDAFEALRPPSPPRMGRDGEDDKDRDNGRLSRSTSSSSVAKRASSQQQPSLLPPLDDEERQRRRDERRRRRREAKNKKKRHSTTVVRPYRRPPLPPLLPWPASSTRSPEDSRLAVTLCVGGWARRREDLVDVWRARGLLAESCSTSTSSGLLGSSSSSSSLSRRDAERYALVWESEALINLSDVVAAWVRNQAAQGEFFFGFFFHSSPPARNEKEK